VAPAKPVAGAPGAAAGVAPGTAAGDLPFEAQDFDSLLASAREGGPSADSEGSPTTQADAAQPPGPLDALADFGRIENPGLRELLAQQRNPGLAPESRDAPPPQPAFSPPPAA